MSEEQQIRDYTQKIFDRIAGVEDQVEKLKNTESLNRLSVASTDTSPADTTDLKKVSIQKLAAPPTNAAYIAFINSPGADTFYLVLEESD